MKWSYSLPNNNGNSNLKKNINFKNLFQSIGLFYFSYFSFITALLSSFQETYIELLLLYFFPVPFIVVLVTILIEVDNQRTISNFKLQEEIKRVKEMYKVRKKTEAIFDGTDTKQK